MSHPLLVEAAESLFVPTAIYNNTEGDADAALRERFEEPAWNNPVVRVLGQDGRDIVQRYSTGWTRSGFARTLRKGLEAQKQPVPAWLSSFEAETRALEQGPALAVFGMT